MNYRKATILSRELATTAATRTLDIDLTDVISKIMVRYEPVNASNTQTAHPAKCVSSIQLVDGSDVLMSLSGQEAQALDFYDTLQGREYEMDMRNAMPDQEIFNINFGRKLWDSDLAFDPKKFNNPQLKISHNRSNGGSNPSSSYLSVYADVFDEKVATPVGWLMAKEFYTFTTSASAYKSIDMPKDYPLRRLLIQAEYAGNSFTDNIDELRLGENNLKKVPIDLNIYHLIAGIMKKYPLYHEIIAQTLPATGGNNTTYVTPGEIINVAPGVRGSPTVYQNATDSGGTATMYSSAPAECHSLVTGFMPHGVLPVDFGNLDDMTDWYDITKIGALELRLHQVAASVTVNVILQQLRKY